MRYLETRTSFPQMDSQRMSRFMKSALNKWQRIAIALGLTATVVVVGCGDDGTGLGRRYKVTGKVTYNGAPVPQGTVNFIPTKPPPPEGRAATGQIKDGYYSLSTTGNDDGALPGDYNIAIVAMDIDMASAASSKAEGGRIHEGDAAYWKAHKNAKKLIPDKYGVSETSGLKATVGTGSNSFDFDLKD
jgi:major membrane immunogen (membrane-anchored lipoprotein)